MSKVILNKYAVFDRIMSSIEGALGIPRATVTFTDSTGTKGQSYTVSALPKLQEWLQKVAYKWLCQAATESNDGVLDEIVIYNLHAILRMRHKNPYDINSLHVYVAQSRDPAAEASYIKAMSESYRSDTGHKFSPSTDPLWIREGSYEHKALLEPTKHTFHKLEIGSHTVTRVLTDLVDFFKANYAVIPDKVTRLTFEEASRKSHDWHELERKRKHREDIIKKSRRGKRKLIHLDEEFAIFDLVDRIACSYEGSLMGHCVGSYYSGVTSGDYKILHIKHLKADEEKEINREYTVQAQLQAEYSPAKGSNKEPAGLVKILQNKSRFNAYPSNEIDSKIEAYLNSPKLLAHIAGTEELPELEVPEFLEAMEMDLFKSYAGKSKFEAKPFDLVNPFTGRSILHFQADGNWVISGAMHGWSSFSFAEPRDFVHSWVDSLSSFNGLPLTLHPKIEYEPHRLETTRYRDGSFHNFGEPPIIGELKDEYDKASAFLSNRGSSRSMIVQALVDAFAHEDPVCWGTPQLGTLTSPYQSVKEVLANHGAKVVEVVDKVRWEWYLATGNFYFMQTSMFSNVMPNAYVMPYHIRVPVQLAPQQVKSSRPATTKKFNTVYDPKQARKLTQAEKNAISREAGITHDPFVTLFFGGQSELGAILGEPKNTYSTANADALRTNFVKDAIRKSLTNYMKMMVPPRGFYYPNAQAIGRLHRKVSLDAGLHIGSLDVVGHLGDVVRTESKKVEDQRVADLDHKAAKIAFFGARYGRPGPLTHLYKGARS